MQLISRFGQQGSWVQVGSLALTLATILTWVAFTTTGWGGYPRDPERKGSNGVHFGLWRKCSDSRYSAECYPLDGWARDWVIAFQAFATLAFVGVNVSLLLLLLFMFHAGCNGDREVEKTAGISCFVTGLLYLVGVAVFAANYKIDYIDESSEYYKYRFGYCFAVSIVAIVLLGVAGLFILLDTRQNLTQLSVTQPGIIYTSHQLTVQTSADQSLGQQSTEDHGGSVIQADDTVPIIQHTQEQQDEKKHHK